MSEHKFIKLNSEGTLEIQTLSTASASADGLMSSIDKERLEYLIEYGSEKIKISDVDATIPEEIVNKIKFDLKKGFILDLDTFNEAKIGLDNFVRFLSDGKNTKKLTTDTLTLSAAPDSGFSIEIGDNNTFFINNNNIEKVFKYQSELPSVLHEIEHNLGTFFINTNIYVEDAVDAGKWTNDICKVKFVSPNKAEIWLSESANIMAIFIKN